MIEQLNKPPTSIVPLQALNPWQELLLIPSYERALSQFGIKTAEGAEEFFRSAAGKSVMNQLEEKVALEHAIEHELDIERNDQKLLESRMMAGLLLWALDKKAEASKKLEEVAQELDKELHEHKAPTPKPAASSSADEKKRLEQEATFYTALSKTTLENQRMLQTEEKELLRRMSDLAQRLKLEPNHPSAKEHQEQLIIAQQKLTGNQATQALMSQQVMQITQVQQIIQSRMNRLSNPNIAPQTQAVAPMSQTNPVAAQAARLQSRYSTNATANLQPGSNSITPMTNNTQIAQAVPKQKPTTQQVPKLAPETAPNPFSTTPQNKKGTF